jgi:hypothetical protein
MIKKYKSINLSDPRIEIPEVWYVIKIDDDTIVPMDFDSQNLLDYLAWLDEGNQPELFDAGDLWRRN